jgi:hypothetical protein
MSQRFDGPPRGPVLDSEDKVLLQIALKLAIFFAFLLLAVASMLAGEVNEARRDKEDAERDRDQAQQAAANAQQALGAVKHTEAGKALVEAAALKEQVQRLALLAAWKAHRPTRPLAVCLTQFADVRRARLEPAEGYLPADPVYATLLAEARRVFLAAPGEKVSPTEVASLLADVWERGGLRPQAREKVLAAVAEAFASSLAVAGGDLLEDRINFKPDVLSRENLCALVKAIRQDLEDERRALVALQLRLFQRVVMDRPVKGLDGTDPLRLQIALVADLKGPLGLLPEVEQRLLAP